MKQNILELSKISVLSLAALSCNQTSKEQVDLSTVEFDYQPNILWISCEDISPYLEMYGDSTIQTPNLSRLATEGIVFENAFTTAGQCAPSRHSIITGMHATATSGSNMRTGGKQFPEDIKCFPLYLMDAGYYCTNNSKTDYNFSEPDHKSLWNECSNTAHWKNKGENQVFFAIYNRGETHESQFLHDKLLRVDPKDVPIPPYYPDIEQVRIDIARNYSNILKLDSIVGMYLKELEDAGLLEKTIVVFWSDHGGPMARQKREVIESGTHVPLIIRLPNQQYAGTRIHDVISLVDLGPTMLSLTGIPTPENMHGKAFMGKFKTTPQKYIYGGRDRIAGMLDMVRYVESEEYLYIHNYYPELPHWFPSAYRLSKIPFMKHILEMRDKGELNAEQVQWFKETKEVEELYDVKADPHSMNNLAKQPEYKEVLETMRQAHINWFLETKDQGLFPEAIQESMEKKYGKTMYEILREENIPLCQIRETALLWTKGKESISQLENSLENEWAVNRYHAAIGLGNLSMANNLSIEKLIPLLEDKDTCVQLAAAYALMKMNKEEMAIPVFKHCIAQGVQNNYIGLISLTLIKRLKEPSIIFEKDLKSALEEQTKIGETYYYRELNSILSFVERWKK